MARAINRGYIDGEMTAYINWPLVAAIYPNLPYDTVGLMVANQPWTGNYSVGKQTWVTAHTTQFTQPGWHYLDAASGYLGGSNTNGSYVTFKSTNTSDYSIVLETVDATAAQTRELAGIRWPLNWYGPRLEHKPELVQLRRLLRATNFHHPIQWCLLSHR